MTQQEQILKDISFIMSEKYGEDARDIHMETSIKEETDLDSLDQVEFLVEVEKKFNVTIDDDTQESIVTVGDVVRCVEDRINQRW